MVNLLRLKLVNFVGIYYGTGLTEIEIDRTKSNNNIILIVGDNGSGKTSIMNELTPLPLEINGDRHKSRILENSIGIKELDLLVDNYILYKIKIIYDKSKTTKCFITKIIDDKETELNPNGNVNSYLEILDRELHITKNYTNIGYLSGGEAGSSNKNFISMKPTERNNYISEWMPEISEFVEAFRISSKILSSLKKNIDEYNKQIGNMTSIDYELELNFVNNNLTEYKNQLNQIQEKITQLNTYNDSLEIHLSDEKELEARRFKLLTNFNKIKYKIDEYTKKWSEIEIPNIKDVKEFQKELDKLIETDKKLIDKLNNIEENLNILATDIESNKNLLNKDEDLSNVDIKTIYTTMEAAEDSLIDVNKSIKEIQKRYDLEEDLSISPTVLIDVNSIIQVLNDKFIQLNNLSTIDEILDMETLTNYTEQKTETLNKINEMIQFTTERLEHVNKEIYKYENSNLDTQILVKRPKFCINKQCGIVDELLKYLNPKDQIKGLYEESDKYTKELVSYNSQKDEIMHSIENYNKIYQIYSEIQQFLYKNNEKIANFPGILLDYFQKNPSAIYIQFNDINAIITDLTEYSSLTIKKTDTEKTLDGLKKIKKFLITNNLIEEKIKDSVIKYDKLQEQRLNIITEYDSNKKKLETYKNAESLIKSKEEEMNYLLELKETFNIVKYNILQAMKVNYVYNSNKHYIDMTLNKEKLDIESEIMKLEKKRDEMTTFYISKRQLEKLRNELLEKQNRITVLNKIWSPKVGYASMIIKSFLNNLTIKTNEDLNNMWGSNLKIKECEINATDFNIVIDKEGNEIEDASLCSQGERSTINTAISFAIIESNIKNNGYDVLRLDEVDGALDENRRSGFLRMIQNRIDEMGCESCFIISHNGEFEDIPCDIILLKSDIPFPEDKLYNKNILFKY